MLLENYNKFLKYFGSGKYSKITIFTILSFIAGSMELIGVAMIYPFIMLIIEPEKIIAYVPYLKGQNPVILGLLIGLCVLLIFIAKNIYMILLQIYQNNLTGHWKLDIKQMFMGYFIYAPYKNTMNITQSKKLYIIQTLCPIIIDSFIFKGLNLITNITIITMIISLLFIKYPLPAILAFFFVITSMIIQNKFFKQKTSELSKKLAKSSRNSTNTLLENITNIKEIKILSAENIFYSKFIKNENFLRLSQTKMNIYSSIPPYVIETLIVMTLLITGSLISIQSHNDNSYLVASFAVIVAALFRIAPALNRVQSAIISINSSRDYVKDINKAYEECNLANFKKANIIEHDKINFKHKIKLSNICFSYNKSKQILKNISFDINKGDFIGIIGLSGAGKSTLADIITGLLPQDSGTIKIDNTELTQENFYKFRHILGYVPQQINIMNNSIKENVAWGCSKIDDNGVIKSLKAAQLYDIIKDFPEGINTEISSGNNGLSQGQKQRLAIARALYRDPEIIILDEATSALDVQIENEITEMLTKIGKSKTIIAIAHRLSTLKSCNKLIYIKEGKLVDIGTFEELSDKYEDFNNLVKLSSIK